jgi:Tol biopolymer transport system component
MNRCVVVLVLAAGLLALAMPAGAATPEGPRLAISVSTDGPGAEDERSEVITTGPSGEGRQRLVGGPGASIGDPLSWSSDGNRLAFAVSGAESTTWGPFGTGWRVVGVAEVTDGRIRVFPRAFLNAGDPVMAPDGRSVAFERAKRVKTPPGSESYLFKSSIWLLDVEDGSVRRLTRWRLSPPFLSPISYSPDGSALIAVFLDRRGFRRLVAIDLRSLRSRLLAPLGWDVWQPTYSPDGTKLAFVRLKQAPKTRLPPVRPVSELVVARADGAGAERVLRRKGYISFPSWDPSGSRLAFTRDPPAEAIGILLPEPGNKVMAINADGTCLTQVFTDPELTLHRSAWRPGTGREAGPIEC